MKTLLSVNYGKQIHKLFLGDSIMKRIFTFLLIFTTAIGISTTSYATESTRNTKLNAGNGITIIINLDDTQSVSAVSDRTANSEDKAIMDCYSIVDGVIHLDITGLPTGTKIVRFGPEYNDFCILDDYLSVLGTNRKPLPLCETYYLIDMEDMDRGENMENLIAEIEESEYIRQEPTSMINDNPNNGGD